jgi:hypothetical protein
MLTIVDCWSIIYAAPTTIPVISVIISRFYLLSFFYLSHSFS